MNVPSFQDVLFARRQISPYLKPTPLYSYPALNALIETSVFIKHENYQPIGAFKVRGGINLISQLSPDERARGVIAASTGKSWAVSRLCRSSIWSAGAYSGSQRERILAR